MLIQNLEIMCRLKEFATHQHSRANEALLSFFPDICHLALSFTTYLLNVTKALPELGYKAAGLGSLLINIW